MRRRTILVVVLTAAAVLLPAFSASAANITGYVEEELQVAHGADGTPQTQLISSGSSPPRARYCGAAQ